jgi:glutaryl-CoA dehydrogenase
MLTRAVKTSGGYVLNGAKMWITNGTIADVAVVWAKLKDEALGREQVRGFVVEKGMKGFSAPEQKRKHSLRASVTSELLFQDVEVPEANLLPSAKGLKAPLSCLSQARYGIAWGVIGAAMSCFHTAAEYSKVRVMFGKPIGGFQLVQEKLARMLTEITKAQLLCVQLGRLKQAGQATAAQVSLAKRNNCEIALDIARDARDLLGANGITAEYPGDAAHVQPRVGQDLRGHAPHPHARARRGSDGTSRVPLTPARQTKRRPSAPGRRSCFCSRSYCVVPVVENVR